MLERLRIDTGRAAARSVETCQLEEAIGRILGEDVLADRDSPPFDYAAMDGYAARVSELEAAFGMAPRDSDPVRVNVVSEARIGCSPPSMPHGVSVVRVATGAPIPPGADVVIKREDVIEHARGAAEAASDPSVAAISITPALISQLRAARRNIRERGENARAGAVVLEAGTILSAASLGTLATVGKSRPQIFAPLRVAIITTGDEIVPPETTPGAFQIRNSNAAVLLAVLTDTPWIDAAIPLHARDDGPDLADMLRDVSERADAVVLSGGVSMGHRDPVRGVIEAEGGDVVFHGLPQRPGKPMLGAIRMRTDRSLVPIFGLPGNPLSAMVTCTRIVMPVLARLAGATRWPGAHRVRVANPDEKTLDIWWHRLVKINGSGDAALLGARGSGDMIAAGQSDGFIELPPSGWGDSRRGGSNVALYPFYPWPT
jgi:molybdenum cofactor synthesis domain-containing protein